MSEKKFKNNEDIEGVVTDSKQSLELKPVIDSDLETLTSGHQEIQRRLIQGDMGTDGFLDNKQLKLLKLSAQDEIEYRRIRAQLQEKSGGLTHYGSDSESLKEFVQDKLEMDFRESCEPMFEEYNKYCAATQTKPSLAQWFVSIDPGRFFWEIIILV